MLVRALRRPSRPALLVAAAVALAALAAAGCGDSSSDSGALEKIESGAAKLAKAKSLDASVELAVELEDQPEGEPSGCVNINVDRRSKPVRVRLLSFDFSCLGGSEAHEVIVIGRRAWVSEEPTKWTAAEVAKGLTDELSDEGDKFRKLFAAAEDVEENGTGAYETRDGDFDEGPLYTFTAPASAFSDAEGSDSTDVDFEAVLDKQSYLRELKAEIVAEGNAVTITQTYEHIDGPESIEPPEKSEIVGPTIQIEDKGELESLIGSTP